MNIKYLYLLTFFFGAIMNISCSLLDIQYSYLQSEKGDKYLTIIDYHKLGEPENACIYIVNGKFEKNSGQLPINNYIKLSSKTNPIWINWQEKNQIIILYTVGDILENKMDSDGIIIKRFYNDDEFKELTMGSSHNYETIFLDELKYF
jgi:hypothetical protein